MACVHPLAPLMMRRPAADGRGALALRTTIDGFEAELDELKALVAANAARDAFLLSWQHPVRPATHAAVGAARSDADWQEPSEAGHRLLEMT